MVNKYLKKPWNKNIETLPKTSSIVNIYNKELKGFMKSNARLSFDEL